MEKPPRAEVDLPFEPGQDLERRLDVSCARVFTTPEGAAILDWLKFHWINTILGPDATDQQIRYREGGRFVVASIMTRMERGRKSPDGPVEPRSRRRPAR